MKTSIVAAVFVAACSPAYAGYLTGNDLSTWCESAPAAKTGAMTYALGVYDTLELASVVKPGSLPKLCVPDDVTRGQIGDVVCSFLQENPAIRHHQASALVWNAMVDAWPCQ